VTDTRLHRRCCDRALTALRWVWNRPHLISAVLCFIAVTYTFTESRSADRAIVESSVRAQTQFCALAEAAHAADVKELADTYEYLDGLPPDDYRQPLNVFVIRRLPVLEAKAHKDDAPPLCDRKGLGLPEPDPDVPERPLDLHGPPVPDPPPPTP
jgi:hypothetical protein